MRGNLKIYFNQKYMKEKKIEKRKKKENLFNLTYSKHDFRGKKSMVTFSLSSCNLIISTLEW